MLALTAPGAGAAIAVVSHSLDINHGGTRSPATSCAPGTVPVSSGFLSGGFSANQGGVVPYASLRTAGGSTATGHNISPTVSGTFTTYAYCDTDARTIVTRAAHVTLPADQQRTATALCPDGTTPISGGYKFTNGTQATGAAFRSRKVRNGWQVAGYNGGPAQSVLRAFAYCQRDGPRLQTRTAATTIPKFKLGSIQALCPAGTRTISGGFDGHLTTSPELRVSVPISSSRTKSGWRVTALAASENTGRKLTAFAYCEPL
jgi:hypothetical protein